MRIVTTSDCNFIGIPFCPPSFFSTELIDITIDWGDSQKENIRDTSAAHIHTNTDGAITVTHNYTTAGQYNIVITGGFGVGGPVKQPGELAFAQTSKHNAEGFAEDYDGRAPNSTVDKILQIFFDYRSSRDNFRVHGQGDFKDFSNTTIIQGQQSDTFILSANPSEKIQKQSDGFILFDQTFKNCTSLIKPPVFSTQGKSNNLLSKATSMQSTFEGAIILGSFGDIKAPSVTNATSMFKNSGYNGSLRSLFRAPNQLQYADSMFEGSKFGEGNSRVHLEHWRLSKVISAKSMFKNSKYNNSLRPLFRAPNELQYADNMFEGSIFGEGKPKVHLEHWRLPKVISAKSMFKNSKYNNSVRPLFEAPNQLQYADNMFEGSKLGEGNAKLNLEHWNLSNLETADSMFKNSEFNGYARNLFPKGSKLKDADNMFEGSKFDGKGKGLFWNLSNVETADSMFKDSLYNGEAKNLFPATGNKLKDADNMFAGSAFNSEVAKRWSFNNVETANNLFASTTVSGEYISNLFKEGSKLISGSGIFKGRDAPLDAVDEWEIPASIKEAETKGPNQWDTEAGSWSHKFITWDSNTVLWTYNKSNHWDTVEVDWEDAG